MERKKGEEREGEEEKEWERTVPVRPIVSQQRGCDLDRHEVKSVNFLTELGETEKDADSEQTIQVKISLFFALFMLSCL